MSNVKERVKGKTAAATAKVQGTNATKLKTSADAAAEKSQSEALATAKKIQGVSIPEQIAAVQVNVGNTLADLTNKLTSTVKDFTSLEAAVEATRAELNDLYGISKQAETLAALINANDEFKAAHETEKAELTAQITDLQNQADQMVHDAEVKAQGAHDLLAERLRVTRARDQETWNWDFAQAKKKDLTQRDEELAGKLKAFQVQVEELDAGVKARLRETADREATVTARELKMAALEAQVAAIPQAIAEAKAEAEAEARKDEKRSAAIEINVAKKNAEAQIGIANAQIGFLTEQLTGEKAKVSDQAIKLDAAYTRIQDMAIKMADSGNKAPVIYNGNGGQGQMVPAGR